MKLGISKHIVAPFLMFSLAAVLLYRVGPYFRSTEVTAGERAPAFDLRGEGGAGVALNDYRGNWVLLNFWATYCKPCVDEMPALNRLYLEYKEQGLVVLGVSIDEDAAAYRRFVRAMGIDFPTALDSQGKVMRQYGTRLVPETYLIDPQGRVVRKYVNWQDWTSPEIVNYLRSLL